MKAQQTNKHWLHYTEYKTNFTITLGDLNAHIEIFPFKSENIGVNFFGGYFIADNLNPYFLHGRSYFGIEPRFYATNRTEGFYVGPMVKYRRIHVDGSYLLFDPALGEPVVIDETFNNNTLFTGITAGVKTPISSLVTIDFYVSFGRLISRLPSDIELEDTDVIFTNFNPRLGILVSLHNKRKSPNLKLF
ncbi:MAG: hypothetical protein LAT76_04025 [Schleiferiaceae bacterium]|nr:hypothetical protein [Schleiferiaceae bacterium]